MNNYVRSDSLKVINQPVGKMLEDFKTDPSRMSKDILGFKLTFSLMDEEERTAPLCQGGEEMEDNASNLV